MNNITADIMKQGCMKRQPVEKRHGHIATDQGHKGGSSWQERVPVRMGDWSYAPGTSYIKGINKFS